MNYIITKHPEFFDNIGRYNFCNLEDMVLPKKLAIDTETTGLFARVESIFCVQIGTGTNNYLIHMYDDNYQFKDLQPYIENKTLVLQNALFDLGFFYKYEFYPTDIRDTMLATKILYNGDFSKNRADFKSIMLRELNVYYDKTSQKNIHLVKLSVDTAIQYSFNDVDRLLECHDVLQEKINDGGFTDTYDLHCRFIKALAYMEQCGLPLDGELWQDKMVVDKKNSKKYAKEVTEYIYDNVKKYANYQVDMFSTEKYIHVKITSPKQMIPVFNALGIATKDRDGKDSINENILTKTKHEFVDLWLKYQNAQHRVTTFGQKIYDKIIDGRIYTSFNPMVETARLSSRRGGINFLNFPSDAATRSCFKTTPENKMIVCDYSAQEGVIMADLSGDKAMVASVVDGVDLHCLLAKAIYPELEGLSDDDIATNHKDKRTFAKPVRFAFSYGGNGYTIWQNLGIVLKEAERIYSVFRKLHQGLYDWGDKVYAKAIRDGYISSVNGWKLWLSDFDQFKQNKKEVDAISRDEWTIYKEGKAEYKRYWLIQEQNKIREKDTPKIIFTPVNVKSYEFFKKKKVVITNYFKKRALYQRLSLNSPVQTRGAHQMKLALCYIFEWILETNNIGIIKMCNAVHDEVVLDVPEKLAEISKEKVQTLMKKAGDHYLTTLTIKADAAIGDSWYEAK